MVLKSRRFLIRLAFTRDRTDLRRYMQLPRGLIGDLHQHYRDVLYADSFSDNSRE